MYTSKEKYLLKIKEKFWMGKDDLIIAGENGRKFVQMKAENFGNKDLRKMIGLEGVEFAGYVIDKANMTAHVTAKLGGKHDVIFTLKKSERWSRKPILDMYFHNPTVDLNEVSKKLEDMTPALILRGDFPGKNYAMMFRKSVKLSFWTVSNQIKNQSIIEGQSDYIAAFVENKTLIYRYYRSYLYKFSTGRVT